MSSKYLDLSGLSHLWSKIKALFATKVNNATNGNFAGLDSNGNLTDSGSKASDFATEAQGVLADSAYQKPQTGIPSTDMSAAVQTSLGKADTALQPNDDVAYIGNVVNFASTVGFDPQSDTVWNKTQTLSSSQQAQARTNINAQETLVSGTNIKTINNESLIGSGNITIQGGGGGGEANVIESISINGITQTVTDKNVDLTVPISTAVYQIVSISQSAYDALVSGGTVSSTTLYLIIS